MKEALLIFLFVAIVAAIGFAAIDTQEYDFPTANMLRRCLDNTECGKMMFCENLQGEDGGIDGRRGHHCRPKFTEGMSCFKHFHCRSSYCNLDTNKCDS